MVNVECEWPAASVSVGTEPERFAGCEGPLFSAVLAAFQADSVWGGNQAAPSPLNPRSTSNQKEERGDFGDTRPCGTGERLSKAIRSSNEANAIEAVAAAAPSPGHRTRVSAAREADSPGHDARVNKASRAVREAKSPARVRDEAEASRPAVSRPAAAGKAERFQQVKLRTSFPGPSANERFMSHMLDAFETKEPTKPGIAVAARAAARR